MIISGVDFDKRLDDLKVLLHDKIDDSFIRYTIYENFQKTGYLLHYCGYNQPKLDWFKDLGYIPQGMVKINYR
jgi:hypothetical protein